MQHLTGEQIITASQKALEAVTATMLEISDTVFFARPASGKWSPAEHVYHLYVSTNTTSLAFSIPPFLLRLTAGKPNRPSADYETLTAAYRSRLAEGGRATGRFIPPEIDEEYTQKKLLEQWRTATEKYISLLQHKTSEYKLDAYQVKHPLLGKITLRELCYFTIYHTEHHRAIIETSIQSKKTNY